jgi:hypothetical protein
MRYKLVISVIYEVSISKMKPFLQKSGNSRSVNQLGQTDVKRRRPGYFVFTLSILKAYF